MSLIDWTKFSQELRREYGEKPTPKHIEAALEKCSEINQNPRRWATIEIIPITLRTIVRVDWGHKTFDGRIEKCIETINFDLNKEGEVIVSRNVHV